jgi:hypothetical protein
MSSQREQSGVVQHTSGFGLSLVESCCAAPDTGHLVIVDRSRAYLCWMLKKRVGAFDRGFIVGYWEYMSK